MHESVCMDVCVLTDVSVGCASVHECGSMDVFFFFFMMCLAGYIPAALCQTAHSSDKEITQNNRDNYGNKIKNKNTGANELYRHTNPRTQTHVNRANVVTSSSGERLKKKKVQLVQYTPPAL